MKIAVTSGKGGTGKTTLSTNLAAFLAEEENPVLADLDVEEPNSGLFIRGDEQKREIIYKQIPEWQKEKCTFSGNCQNVCNFNAILKLGPEILVFPELCHSCYACSELCPSNALDMVPHRIGELIHYKFGRLDFVEGRLDIGQEQAVPMIAQTKEYVSKNFPGSDITIFDTPPGTSCPVIESIKDADYVILVTEPTPFGLHDLKLAVDVVEKLELRAGVVLNRHGIGNDSVEKYCEMEEIPLIAKIPNSRKIAELYSRGEMLYDKIPEFKEQLELIAKSVRRAAL